MTQSFTPNPKPICAIAHHTRGDNWVAGSTSQSRIRRRTGFGQIFLDMYTQNLFERHVLGKLPHAKSLVLVLVESAEHSPVQRGDFFGEASHKPHGPLLSTPGLI